MSDDVHTANTRRRSTNTDNALMNDRKHSHFCCKLLLLTVSRPRCSGTSTRNGAELDISCPQPLPSHVVRHKILRCDNLMVANKRSMFPRSFSGRLGLETILISRGSGMDIPLCNQVLYGVRRWSHSESVDPGRFPADKSSRPRESPEIPY